MRATSQLRQLLKSGKTLFVPGCYNALSARILADVGFPAVYMTGYDTSLSLLGMPDTGLATMTTRTREASGQTTIDWNDRSLSASTRNVAPTPANVGRLVVTLSVLDAVRAPFS